MDKRLVLAALFSFLTLQPSQSNRTVRKASPQGIFLEYEANSANNYDVRNRQSRGYEDSSESFVAGSQGRGTGRSQKDWDGPPHPPDNRGPNNNGPPGLNKRGPPGNNNRGPPGLSGRLPPGLINRGKPGNGGGGSSSQHHGNGKPPSKDDKYPEGHNDMGNGNGKPGNTGDQSAQVTPSYPGPVGPGNRGDQSKGCRQGEFHCQSGECLPEAVRCDNRHDCRDSSDEAKCVATSERFTPDDFEADRTGCVLPKQPDGGDYELGGCGPPCPKQPGEKVPRNSILTFSCRKGYVLRGNTISACLNDQWYQPPTCQKTCSPLESSSVDIQCEREGKVVVCNEPIEPGTTATLKCKASYKLPVTNDPGYRQIRCLPEGLWDRTIFRCLPECGTAVSHGNTLVVNGFNAKVGAFPWHVGVYEKNKRGNFVQICGGTLIGESLVISAAHCFYDDALNRVRSESNFGIAAGKYYRTWEAEEDYVQKSLVKEIKVADRYIGARGNFAEDIALVKLTTPFSLTALVRPICLDWDNVYEREQLQPGQTGKVVGWGKDSEGVSSESLQEINLPFVSYSQCLSTVPADFRGYITSDKFCAGYINGSSLCEGDSGGGLCFEKQGVWYLRGIVSVSPVKDGSCDYENYVGFTYVSYFRHWIRDAYVTS